MAVLIPQKQIEAEFRFLRSPELPYINGALLNFSHDWNQTPAANFDPATDLVLVEVCALCVERQSGWIPGDRIILDTSRVTINITDGSIEVQTTSKGLQAVKKNGNNAIFELDNNRWLLYVNAIQRISNT